MPHVTRVAPKFRYDGDEDEVVLHMSAPAARAVLNGISNPGAPAGCAPIRTLLEDALDGSLSRGETEVVQGS